MKRERPKEPGGIQIGCAGWSIPKEYAIHFSNEGSILCRYAARFTAVEINSSFYRPHRPATYAKWAQAVPDGFKFSAKVPKDITHAQRLVDVEDKLDQFLSEVTELGDKFGPLLIQLPPSLKFSSPVVEHFAASLRERFDGEVALEPRHASWVEGDADRLLKQFRVARVAADPAVVAAAAKPNGWDGLVYYRLHGSPKMYYSAYSEEYLEALSQELWRLSRSASVWCIFDNTATGAATRNALRVQTEIGISGSDK